MASQIFDTVIRQACVVDGSGSPSYIADIGMADGGISAVAPKLSVKRARQIIDADGLVAAPGFIDSHSHDDVYLLVDSNGSAKIRQGVTTVIIGNCGFSAAPVLPETQSQAIASLAIIGADHLPTKLDQGWRFSQFLDILEQVQPAINVVPLVGHGTLRIAVMGIEKRPANSEDRHRMRYLLEEAMRAGAFGLSSGLVYVPGAFANTDELIDLARVTAANGGLYATHLRSEADQVMDAIDEALEIGRQAQLPVHISHHKVMGRKNWGRSQETLEYLQKARVEGMRVTCDVYPYTAGSTSLASALPPSLQAEGPEVFAEKLKNQIVRSEVRKIIENETSGDWENLIYVDTFEGMVLVRAPRNQEYCGRSIADIAEKERRDPYDVFFDLVVEEKMDAVIVEFMMQEDDVIRILKHPLSMVATDGIPSFGPGMFHPRFTNTFPRVLGRYVREKQCLRMEEAIRKMSGLPADTFGLDHKGYLKQGYDADIVLFDPGLISDQGTYTKPWLEPKGIEYVLVNGNFAFNKGRISSERWGQVLRR